MLSSLLSLFPCSSLFSPSLLQLLASLCDCVYVDIGYKKRRLYVYIYIHINNVLYVVAIMMMMLVMMLLQDMCLVLPYSKSLPSMKMTSRGY